MRRGPLAQPVHGERAVPDVADLDQQVLDGVVRGRVATGPERLRHRPAQLRRRAELAVAVRAEPQQHRAGRVELASDHQSHHCGRATVLGVPLRDLLQHVLGVPHVPFHHHAPGEPGNGLVRTGDQHPLSQFADLVLVLPLRQPLAEVEAGPREQAGVPVLDHPLVEVQLRVGVGHQIDLEHRRPRPERLVRPERAGQLLGRLVEQVDLVAAEQGVVEQECAAQVAGVAAGQRRAVHTGEVVHRLVQPAGAHQQIAEQHRADRGPLGVGAVLGQCLSRCDRLGDAGQEPAEGGVLLGAQGVEQGQHQGGAGAVGEVATGCHPGQQRPRRNRVALDQVDAGQHRGGRNGTRRPGGVGEGTQRRSRGGDVTGLVAAQRGVHGGRPHTSAVRDVHLVRRDLGRARKNQAHRSWLGGLCPGALSTSPIVHFGQKGGQRGGGRRPVARVPRVDHLAQPLHSALDITLATRQLRQHGTGFRGEIGVPRLDHLGQRDARPAPLRQLRPHASRVQQGEPPHRRAGVVGRAAERRRRTSQLTEPVPGQANAVQRRTEQAGPGQPHRTLGRRQRRRPVATLRVFDEVRQRRPTGRHPLR